MAGHNILQFRALNPERELAEKMATVDLHPSSIILDGCIHRFSTKPGDSGDDAGWYVGYADGIPSAVFGDFRNGLRWAWRANTTNFTAEEDLIYRNRLVELKRLADKEREERRETASIRAMSIWENALPATPDHPYLIKKSIEPHIARVDGAGTLILPMVDGSGHISSLQFISPSGEKKFLPGGSVKGKFCQIGTVENKIYVVEGYATGATVYDETKIATVIAFSASNLVQTVEILRKKHKTAEIVIVADNDASGVGKNYADQASAKYGASVIMPPEIGMDANDYKKSGGDLQELLNPKKNEWLTPIDDWLVQPAPIKWLIKGWLQTPALSMVHGPSGDGKTFIVLDMALHIATGKPEWMGCKLKQGNVAYLAGEGHHGLRSRVAAWCQKNGEKPRNMYVSSCATDINTPAGAVKTISELRKIQGGVKLVIIDTLHRFLDGDENSAQDAKGMIDTCNLIQREFDCTVLIVHHTGVADGARDRARGSSAWKGAMENEISITKKDDVIKIEAMKIKDAEKPPTIFAELEKIDVKGWIDEDGEQVTSAVIRRTIEPERKESGKKEQKIIREISDVWFDSGREIMDGVPYITSNAIGEYVRARLGKDGSSGRVYKKRLIDDAENSGLIERRGNGFVIIDEKTAGGLVALSGIDDG